MKVWLSVMSLSALLVTAWFFRGKAPNPEEDEAQAAPGLSNDASRISDDSTAVQPPAIGWTPSASPSKEPPRFSPALRSGEASLNSSSQIEYAPARLAPEASMLAHGGYLKPEDYDAQVEALEKSKSDGESLQFSPVNLQVLEASLVRQSRIAQPSINTANSSLNFQVTVPTHELNLSPATP